MGRCKLDVLWNRRILYSTGARLISDDELGLGNLLFTIVRLPATLTRPQFVHKQWSLSFRYFYE